MVSALYTLMFLTMKFKFIPLDFGITLVHYGHVVKIIGAAFRFLTPVGKSRTEFKWNLERELPDQFFA